MKILNYFLLLIFLLGCFQITNGQETVKLKYDKSGNIRYIKFDGINKTGDWESPSSSGYFFNGILGLKEPNKFTLRNKIEHKYGSYSEIYRQVYNNIEVEGGIYILIFKNGKLIKANGHIVNITETIPSSRLSPEEASNLYAEYLHVSDTLPLHFFYGMVIAEIEEVSGNDTIYTAKLCYKIDLLNILSDNGETGYIDALSGKVLKTAKRYHENSATGTFYTLYSDTKAAGTQFYNNNYNLCDSSRNVAIHTWDLNNNYYVNYLFNRVEFTDDNNIWTVGEHSADNDQVAQDIHWALQEIYDYFYDNHEEFEGFDDNNHDIDAYAHSVFESSNRDNAAYAVFANGYEAFFFGDGQSYFEPLGALDVVSHEYGHAITFHFTGLEDDDDEMSAINEGFSDIWGAVIESSVAPEKSCWKTGEEIINVSGDDCVRNIEDPESPTAYIKMADTYDDDTFNDPEGNIYTKSGIMSHWFYLLAEGGIGINDNNDHFTVYGLGIDYAAQIVFEGHTSHFADVNNYAEARVAMIDASDIIYGENSIQSLQVANAWYAVGVGTNPSQVTISGPSQICSSSATFSISPLVTYDDIQWNIGANLNITSGQGTSSCTIIATGYGTSSVSVTVTANGNSITLPQKTVYAALAGPPLFDVSGPGSIVLNSTEHYVADILPRDVSLYGIYYYDWSVTSKLQFESSHAYRTDAYIKGISLGFGTISFYTTNGCGTSTFNFLVRVVSSKSLSIYPNPASNEITIEIDDEANFEDTSSNLLISESIPDAEYLITVYNNSGMPVFINKYLNVNEIRINTSSWQKGIYYVILTFNEENYSGALIIE